MPNTTTDTVLAALPWFPGFYETILSSYLDREIEQEMESTGESYSEIEKRYSPHLAMHAIAKAWVNAFSQESGIPMEFDEVQSPREYNFTTDRLFVRIPIDTIEQIASQMNDKPLRETIRKNHSSRSGFISFYPDDLDDPEWQKPVRDWDHNQLMTLIEAKLIQDEHEWESFQETLYDTPQVYEAACDGWFTPQEAPCAS